MEKCENNQADLYDLLQKEWLRHQKAINAEYKRDDQSCLYHYTTAEGLIGILSSNSVRATDINYLNDSSEMKYGLEVLKHCQRELIQEYSSDRVTKLLEMVGSTLELLRFPFRPLVVCFCEQGNLLSQWRSYAPNGRGFAIGFYRRELFQIGNSHLNLFKITYDREAQKNLLKNGMRIVCEDLKKEFVNFEDRDLNTLSDYLSRWLARCLLSFKHPLFEEEQEWRLVYLPSLKPLEFENVGFNVVNGTIKPYLSLRLTSSARDNERKLPIKEIISGPTHPETIEYSLMLLITKYQYHNVTIKSSNIPFTG